MTEHMESACPACQGKTTQRSDEEKRKLVVRLNRIEGQVRGVKRMLEEDAYCNDVLTQCAAISAALNAFNRELLRAHISGCVTRDIRQGKDEIIDELINTIQLFMR